MIRCSESNPNWVLGFQDECWWSRVSEPNLRTWGKAGEPLRLLEKKHLVPQGEIKAVSCYGLLRDDTDEMLLRFVEGRPVSECTEQFLAWVCAELAAEGKKALLLVWDNASWHLSKRVRAWIKAHNRRVKREGGVRIVVCWLPAKSPWLNNIEPKWTHGKRAVAEPGGVLTPEELRARIHTHFGCDETAHLSKLAA